MGTFTLSLSATTPPYWIIPDYAPTYWNDIGLIQYTNNCYNYAANRSTNTQAQPGNASGNPLYEITPFSVRAGLLTDGFEETTATGISPEGKMKIAAVFKYSPDYPDFHFYRQGSDGMWSGKPGITKATNKDNSNQVIYDPAYANRGLYEGFIGYFFVPVVNSGQGQGLANVD